MLPPPRSTPVAVSWPCGLWVVPESPLRQDPEVAEKKVPDEEDTSDLVCSISDWLQGLRDGVDGGTGSLQEGQIYGANRRNSGSDSWPRSNSWCHHPFTNRPLEREPPSCDPFPADAAWVDVDLGSWVLFYVTCRTLRRRWHIHQANWWVLLESRLEQRRQHRALLLFKKGFYREGRGGGGSRALLGFVDTIWSSCWRNPTTAERRCRS